MDDDIWPLHGADADVSDSQALGGYLDKKQQLIYFGQRGERIPIGSYKGAPVACLVAFAVWFISILLLTSSDERSPGRMFTGILTITVLFVVLAVPFPLRRMLGNEGKLESAIRRGDVIPVRASQPHARDLLGFAHSHAVGYVEQAEELARADALPAGRAAA